MGRRKKNIGRVRRKYHTGNDFFLEYPDVDLWIDTCGMDWMPGQRSWNHKVSELGRLIGFSDIMERRGNMVAVPKVGEELGDTAIDYFSKKKREYEMEVRGMPSGCAQVRCIQGKLDLAKKGIGVYKLVRDVLMKNYEELGGVRDEELAARAKYICKCEGLHEGEMKSIVDMVSAKGKNGFASADGDAVSTCKRVLLELHVPGIVYDSRYSEATPIS